MPISAAGRADAAQTAGRAVGSSPNGFTLVELLVVMTIIALVSATVVLAMPDPRGNLLSEAERFAARARAAQDRAIMNNRPMALRVSQSGYGFDERAGGTWRALTEKPFAVQPWSEGVDVAASGEGRIVFDTTGFADPLHLSLSRGGEQVAVDIANGGTIRVAH